MREVLEFIVEQIVSGKSEDELYFKAIEDGDEELVKSLVENKAKQNGYDVGPVYHGTVNKFTKFRKKMSGIWVANDLIDASPGSGTDASYTMNLFVNLGGKPLVMSDGDLKDWRFSEKPLRWMDDYLTSHTLIGERKRPTSVKVGNYALVLTNPTQLKSADPLTYDKKGKVIPLSQRFDSSNPDIRY